MPQKPFIYSLSVNTLTTVMLLLLCSCSMSSVKNTIGTPNCKNRAYSQMVLDDFISRRYDSRSPVRIGVIPFSVPANFATRSAGEPGVDYQLAWDVQQKLLAAGAAPIVEVFNRLDWPGKKEEFFAGNFGAINSGRRAGYDFVLVGSVPTSKQLRELSAYTKLIEVESGITIFYGLSSVENYDSNFMSDPGFLWTSKDRPDQIQFQTNMERLSECIVESVLSKEPTP